MGTRLGVREAVRARGGVVMVAALIALSGASFFAEGCGGSHHGSLSGPPTGGAALSGTAAHGFAIANATVTIKDRSGNTRTGTTNSSGNYTIDVTGTQQPLLVKVDLPTGTSVFSVAALGSGVCNVTPLTDLIVQTYFQVQGTTATSAFATLTNATKLPTPVEVTTIAKVVLSVVGKALQNQGLDPTTVDLITTTFTTNGTGIDAVLDQTTVSAGTVTVTSGTTTQKSTITTNPSAGTISVATTTTSPAGATTSTDATTLPSTSNFQTAVNGVGATLAQFQSTVNAKGAALAASDLVPYLATNFLHDSQNATIFTGQATTSLRGLTINSFTVDRVNSYDDTNKIVDVSAIAYGTPSGSTTTIPVRIRMTFQLVGGAWLMRGNQQLARFEVQAEVRTSSSSSGTSSQNGVNVDVGAVVSTVAGGTVSGGSVFTNAPLQKGQPRSQTLMPTPNGSPTLYVEDDFFALAQPATVSAGTVFTGNLTPSSGPTVSYSAASNGITTEPVAVTAPTTHSLASVVSSTVAVSWSLPTTFAVSEIRLSGHVSDGTTTFQIKPAGGFDKNLPTTATSATMSYPGTMPGSGNAITMADFNLIFVGPNGERSNLFYTFP